MQQIFSSPIIQENTSHMTVDSTLRGALTKYLENARYALTYHLASAVPKGGIICALFPKTILQSILPEIAKQKKFKVITIGGTPGATKALMDAGILDQYSCPEDADLYITEPDGFTSEGILARPEETKFLQQFNPVAIGIMLQWTAKTPATHDLVRLENTITENGRYKISQLQNKEISVSSLTKPPVPFPA